VVAVPEQIQCFIAKFGAYNFHQVFSLSSPIRKWYNLVHIDRSVISLFKHYANKYARWIRAIGMSAIVFGIISGIVFWLDDLEDNFVESIAIFALSIVSGVLLFGLSEIIECLYRIYQRFETADRTKRILEDESKTQYL
jgi:hypothetical protein